MKYVFIVLFSVCLLVLEGKAQNVGIRFEENSDWRQVVKKATSEKKLIFVDCYTSWCGPCKRLVQTVFPEKVVGDYFNKYFVSVKYDMEKDSAGILLNKKHQITAYPTLLFIDPATEEVVHKTFGFLEKEQLLAVGKQAVDPKGSLRKLELRFDQGDRGLEFLKSYSTVLILAGERNKQREVMLEYLNHLAIKDFAEKENWNLLKTVGPRSFSKAVKHMVDSLDYTHQVIGKEKVNQYLYSVLYYTVYEVATWSTKKKENFDEARNDELISCLKNFDSKYTPGMLATLSTAKFVRLRDFDGMLGEMRKNLQANIFVDQQGLAYYYMFMDQLVLCEDNDILQQGVDWLQKELDKTMDLNLKSNFVRRKGNLLKRQGKEEDAKFAIVFQKVCKSFLFSSLQIYSFLIK